ncbi:MAG: septum formation initiator family protein [Ferruginibacter sp.]
MQFLKGTFTVLKNKYIVTALLFVLWMLFFDEKDWSSIENRKDKLQELQKSEKALTAQIAETRKELGLLKTSAHTIEQFAREKYYMKKDNEDVFIVNTP